jgi:hypothetical protein
LPNPSVAPVTTSMKYTHRCSLTCTRTGTFAVRSSYTYLSTFIQMTMYNQQTPWRGWLWDENKTNVTRGARVFLRLLFSRYPFYPKLRPEASGS